MKKQFYNLIILLIISLVLCIPNLVKAKENEVSNLDELKTTLENIKTGDTLTILNDISIPNTGSNPLLANLPDNVIFDLNGNTITINNMGFIFTGNNITIKNGTFSTSGSYSLWIGDDSGETVKATIKDITTIGGLNIYNATEVVLQNVNSTGTNYYSVWIDNGASATIESGNYSTNATNGLLGVSSDNDLNNPLTLKGGTFNTNNNKLMVSGERPKPIITGGTFNIDVTEYLSQGYLCNKNNNYYIVNEVKKEVEIPKLNLDNTNEVNIGITDNSNINNILINTLNSNSEIDTSNKNTKVTLEVNKIENNTDIIEKINNEINKKIKNATIVDYFDISINVIDTNNNNLIGSLRELNEKINLTVTIPEKLQQVKKGYTRKYFIIREHNNTYEILDTKLSNDGKTIDFETDKFSTYTLIYIDEKEIENPNTYDSVNTYIISGIASLVGFIIIILYKKLVLN